MYEKTIERERNRNETEQTTHISGARMHWRNDNDWRYANDNYSLN